MSATITGIGMVVQKRENEVNGTKVMNLRVQCTLGSYKLKQKTVYDCAIWGKLAEVLSPMIRQYDKETKTPGTEILFIGELLEESIDQGKYVNKKVRANQVELLKNLVGKDEQEAAPKPSVSDHVDQDDDF